MYAITALIYKKRKKCIDLKKNKVHKINKFIKCNTKCLCFYIGNTTRRLKDRVAEHKYAIRTNNMDYPMVRHFLTRHNKDDSLLKVEGTEHIEKPTRGGVRLNRLLQIETFLIDKLDSLNYPGLNED